MLYIQALHIIFIVTWFSGLFYIVRLFIYNTEANSSEEPARSILQNQFRIMIKRLWLGITWPSAVLTLIFGPWTMVAKNWHRLLDEPSGRWLLIKLFFVVLLYGYHFSLHRIYKEEMRGQFRFSSQQLRVWNEVATIFLIAIVMLATVKQAISLLWGLVGLIGLMVVLLVAIRLYKRRRLRAKSN